MQNFRKLRKISALAVAIVFCIVLFFSGLFLAEHTHHDCTGERCPVCAQLGHSTAVLRALSLGGLSAVPLAAILQFLRSSAELPSAALPHNTLLALRIRLND